MADLDPGLPRLTVRLMPGHPLACRRYGCPRPVAWMDLRPQALSVGWCDKHRSGDATIPIAIFGREYQGWCQWPESLVAYLHRSH